MAPPPVLDTLPVKVLSRIVTFPEFESAPPSNARPLANVSRDSVTVAPASMVTSRVRPPPSSVTGPCVGPVMARFFAMDKGVRSVMVCGAIGPGKPNITRPPFPQASAIAWRSEPGPLSAVVVTAAAGLHEWTVWLVEAKLGPDVVSPLYATVKNRAPTFVTTTWHCPAATVPEHCSPLSASTNTVPVGAGPPVALTTL